MAKAQIALRQFVVSRKPPTILLHLAYEALHQVALAVQMLIAFNHTLPIPARRYHRHRAPLHHAPPKLIGVITAISYHIITLQSLYQLSRLRDVMLLAACQDEPQRIAQRVHAYVRISRETAFAPCLAPANFATLFLCAAPAAQGCARIISAVHYQMFHIHIVGEAAEHALPYAFCRPSSTLCNRPCSNCRNRTGAVAIERLRAPSIPRLQ